MMEIKFMQKVSQERYQRNGTTKIFKIPENLFVKKALNHSLIDPSYPQNIWYRRINTEIRRFTEYQRKIANIWGEK